jgi:hypothetical protein
MAAGSPSKSVAVTDQSGLKLFESTAHEWYSPTIVGF